MPKQHAACAAHRSRVTVSVSALFTCPIPRPAEYVGASLAARESVLTVCALVNGVPSDQCRRGCHSPRLRPQTDKATCPPHATATLCELSQLGKWGCLRQERVTVRD